MKKPTRTWAQMTREEVLSDLRFALKYGWRKSGRWYWPHLLGTIKWAWKHRRNSDPYPDTGLNLDEITY